MTSKFVRCFLLVFGLCCVVAVHGGEYPERPVRLLVPFPPGGASDFAGRATTSTMKKEQIIQRLQASGADVATSQSPEEYAAFVRGDAGRWGTIIKASGRVSR